MHCENEPVKTMKPNIKKSMKNNFQILKPLFTLCKIIGLWPQSTNWDNKRRLIYPFVISIFFFFSYSYGTYGKMTYTSQFLYPTVTILALISDVCLLVASIGSLILIHVVKYKKLHLIIDSYETIDEQFNCIKLDTKRPCQKLYIELVITHIVYLIYYIYYSVVWMDSVGWSVYQYFILREYQLYHLLVLALLLRYFALSIKFRFEILNDVLNKLFTAHMDGIIFFKDFEVYCLKNHRHLLRERSERWDMLKIKSIYTKLASLVEIYNDIFGFQFVLFYINIVVNLIGPINIALVYGDGTRNINGATFGIELNILSFIWGGIPLMLAILLYSACNQGEEEAARTITVCYNLIENLGNGEKDVIFKNELVELVHQVGFRKVQFKAGGFFVMNYNGLFCLLGSVASYVIVLVQFIK